LDQINSNTLPKSPEWGFREYSILFVCLGNICRSPMAEGIFLKILQREKISTLFEIDSAGLLSYHEGELPDSRMRFHASRRGYNLTHRSRPVKKSDFDRFDWIIGMDEQNIRGLNQLANSEQQSKIHLITDFCQKIQATHVPDPYYGGDQGFENVIDLLEDACEGLYAALSISS
jgi:protein-tyrosine phosphatase